MKSIRSVVGGLGNILFKEAYLMGKMLNGDIPDVYVQSQKYWKQYETLVKARFSDGIKSGSIQKVSLHIRRGDYVENPFYVDLTTTDYYERAIKKMDNSCYTFDGHGVMDLPHYLVFCKDNQDWEKDKADRQWCRDYLDTLIPGRYEMVSKDNEEWQDMNLMASCIAHIMANSSFSWWAAFLGGGLTVAPKEWFTDGEKRIDLLQEWIRL